MGLFKNNKKTGLIADIIRCDEPSYLIWKWHPDGKQLGEHDREYAIRWGSTLRVKDGEVAVFVYKQKDGTMQDYIAGPYDQKLKTANFPVLSGILGAFVGGDTPFQAEVFFINLANIIQTKFAVPFFDVCDPRYPDFAVPMAVRGTISFKIADYREFIKLHRLDSFHLDNFQNQIKDAVSRYVKHTVTNAPVMHNIPVVQIESKMAQISAAVEHDLGERLRETFGVVASGVDIGSIEIDKSSEGYQQLMRVTKDIAGATAMAKAEANIKNIADKQRIEAENYQETLRVQREESQYAQHMHTRSANFGAYQVEKQAEVGVAGAEALGEMGSNGAGNVNIGGGSDGTGFNMAAMMASMAVGGAVGQNIAGAMNHMMGGIRQQTPTDTVPPPIPVVAYHVAINGQAAGPFDISTLTQMVASGQLTADTLVWKQGMAGWEKACHVDDLGKLFPPSLM